MASSLSSATTFQMGQLTNAETVDLQTADMQSIEQQANAQTADLNTADGSQALMNNPTSTLSSHHHGK